MKIQMYVFHDKFIINNINWLSLISLIFEYNIIEYYRLCLFTII